MGLIPFNDLDRATSDRMGVLVEGSEEHVQIREFEAAGILGVHRKLGGIAMTSVEGAEVLAANGFEAVLIDDFDPRELQVLGDEHVPPAEGEDHGVITGIFWRFVMRDEAERRFGCIVHGFNLTESAAAARGLGGAILCATARIPALARPQGPNRK
jgi:hypothetical protein